MGVRRLWDGGIYLDETTNIGTSMKSFLTLITLFLLFTAPCYAELATPTDCDVLAAHPSDPDKISKGVGGDNPVMLIPAIAACKDAVSKDPDNRRLRYQLGRVLFYFGNTDEAWPHLQYAATNGSSQAQFVTGYIMEGGYGGIKKDSCGTAKLWVEAANQGRLAAMVSYPRHYIDGKFDGCPNLASVAEMNTYISIAKDRFFTEESPAAFYRRLVVVELEKDFAAFTGK